MKKVSILFLHLIIAFIVIVVGMSLCMRISPLKFFETEREIPWINIVYISLLYISVMGITHHRALKDGYGGIRGLGLSLHKFVPQREILLFLSSFALFCLYIAIVVAVGGHIKLGKNLWLISLEGVLAGFLFSIAEEVLFRGYIYKALKENISFIPAMIISSSIFSVLHIFRRGNLTFKIMYFIGLLMLGIILCVAVERTKSLWSSISIHTALITGMFLKSHFISTKEVDGILWGLQGEPISGIGTILMLCLLLPIIYTLKEKPK